MTYISNTVLTISMFQQKQQFAGFNFLLLLTKTDLFLFLFFLMRWKTAKQYFFTKNTQRLFYFASLSLLMSVYQE